jgi:hypothetical protein
LKPFETDRARILLSAQRALLDNVFDRLRAVGVDWDDKSIRVTFYVDGELRKQDQESIDDVHTQMLADMYSNNLDISIVRADAPVRLGSHLAWVYRRREVPTEVRR